MKKILPVLVLLCTSTLFSQQIKRANNWFFGSNAGLNFAGGTPTVVNGSPIASPEASAVMSDTSGMLLFYTDGSNVWNRNHVLMPNGTGLKGGNSSTQGALIVPKPASDSLYYIFTLDEIGDSAGLEYSVVNMNLQGGLGDVTATKNVTLSAMMTEKLTGVKDPGSNRYWIAAHEWSNNNFNLYALTSAGLQPKITQSIGMVHSTSTVQNTYGQMKFSPCANKIGYAAGYLNTVEVFNFNPTTGVLSNPITLTFGYHVYGFEFSPDGNFIYVTTYDPNGTLIQFNLNAGNQSAIISSGQVLSVNDLRQLQLANNGKIYVCQSFDNYLGVIANPTVAGAGCNYQDSVVNLDPGFNGNMSNLGLPNFVTSFMKLPQFTCTATGTVTGLENKVTAENFVLYPNPSSGSFKIKSADGTHLFIYSSTGALVEELRIEAGKEIEFGENYAKGIYFVRMTNSGITFKIIKE